MAEDEIDFTKIESAGNVDEKELTLDDLSGKYIAHPKVGETTPVMLVQKIVKTKDVLKTDKEGASFSIALKTKDGKSTGEAFILKCDIGDYTVGSWEEFFKIKELMVKLKRVSGFKIQIAHLANGMVDKQAQKESRCYDVKLIEG